MQFVSNKNESHLLLIKQAMPRDPKMESLSAKCTQPPFWQVSSASERTQPDRNDYSAQYIQYTTIWNQGIKSTQLSEQLYN